MRLPRGTRGRRKEQLLLARMRVVRARSEAERRFPVITELTARLFSPGLLDSATRMASQLFLTSIPLLFAVAAFAPEGVRNQMNSSLRSLFGISGASAEQLRQALYSPGDLRQTTGIIGLLMALLSGTSCSRAVARVCEHAWQLPKSGTRVAAWRWLLWIACWVVVLLFQGVLRNGFGAGLWLGLPLTFAASFLVWWWTARLLLSARIRWLSLVPGALLTAIASTAMSLTARIYMPIALNRSLAQYGSLGLVLMVLSWLIAFCIAVTFAITAGAVLAQERPLSAYLGPTGPERRGT
ncbi:ribonuclease BN [Kitasatospora xanthocidica]|uniref:Ribonuclease BN n=1 Tax=Kitasatospora xanthocidica TaxID=83382 RepID=A0A372ZKF3_9ACTN|nr:MULTISPECIES: YhjD/YihY/BrkB family envelope integrity protein [Kitasatospora]RGD55737.1 ribonuclease BN [Kitasatospora xanthocidica]